MRFFFPASRCLERGWSLDPVERQHPHRQVMKFRESREVSFLPKPRWNLARSRATWAPLWEICLEIIGRVFVFVWGVLVAAPFCKSFYIKWFNWKMTSTSPIKFIDILSFCSNSQINRNGQVYASTTLTGRPDWTNWVFHLSRTGVIYGHSRGKLYIYNTFVALEYEWAQRPRKCCRIRVSGWPRAMEWKEVRRILGNQPSPHGTAFQCHCFRCLALQLKRMECQFCASELTESMGTLAALDATLQTIWEGIGLKCGVQGRKCAVLSVNSEVQKWHSILFSCRAKQQGRGFTQAAALAPGAPNCSSCYRLEIHWFGDPRSLDSWWRTSCASRRTSTPFQLGCGTRRSKAARRRRLPASFQSSANFDASRFYRETWACFKRFI